METRARLRCGRMLSSNADVAQLRSECLLFGPTWEWPDAREDASVERRRPCELLLGCEPGVAVLTCPPHGCLFFGKEVLMDRQA